MERELLSVNDFAKRNGMGLTKAYDELRSGRLKALKIGKLTRISKAEELRWRENLPAAAFGG